MGVLRTAYYTRQLLKANEYNQAQIEKLQQKSFRKLLRYTVKHSPFYRRKYAEAGIAIEKCQITDLPVVTKKEMMDHFDEFVTDRRLKKADLRRWLDDKSNLSQRYLGKFVPFQTSGSTGENALVIYDDKALSFVHAAAIARHDLPKEPTGWEQFKIFLKNLFIKRMRLATVVMTGGPYPAYTAASSTPKLHHLFVNQKIFPLRDPVPKIVADLNEFQPDAMLSYSSLLGVLAREQLAGRLKLKFEDPLSAIVSTSEPLPEAVKILGRKAWGRDLCDTYGTAECFTLAHSCSQHDRMHVYSDLCILEIVDRHYQPVPDGQVGEKVLVTNLYNFVQPFIRYEVTDVTGYSTDPCPCGRPFPTLLRVEGRTDDIFYIDRSGGGYEAVHPYLFLGPIVELIEVREYQLVQTDRNEVTFYYVPVDPAANLEGRIRQVLEHGMECAGLRGRIAFKLVQVEKVAHDPKSGKYRQIISRIGPPADLEFNE